MASRFSAGSDCLTVSTILQRTKEALDCRRAQATPELVTMQLTSKITMATHYLQIKNQITIIYAAMKHNNISTLHTI